MDKIILIDHIVLLKDDQIMSNLKPEATEKALCIRDKIFIGLGVTMIIVALVISRSECAASPSLTWLTFIVGLYLVLRGMKKLIYYTMSRTDNFFVPFIAYRITRWIFRKIFLIIMLVLNFFISAISGEDSRSNTDKSSPIPSTNPRDGAWDVASDHYYDKEPPPPFS